jgi:hypothetical protein
MVYHQHSLPFWPSHCHLASGYLFLGGCHGADLPTANIEQPNPIP